MRFEDIGTNAIGGVIAGVILWFILPVLDTLRLSIKKSSMFHFTKHSKKDFNVTKLVIKKSIDVRFSNIFKKGLDVSNLDTKKSSELRYSQFSKNPNGGLFPIKKTFGFVFLDELKKIFSSRYTANLAAY